jgi:hypothetical protein
MGEAGAGATAPSCTPRKGCQRLCQAFGADPAGCGVGDATQCGCICEERFNRPCPNELAALADCVGDAPSIDCSLRGRVFPGCESQSIALQLCDFQAREQLCAQSFPLCTPYCQALTLSFCAQGPASVTSCLCGCEATLATACASQFDAFMSCSNAAPAFTCDAEARPAATGCGLEWQSLQLCAGGALDPDAGG